MVLCQVHRRIREMVNTEADNNEREFVERCKVWKIELLDQMKRERPVMIPQYERQ